MRQVCTAKMWEIVAYRECVYILNAFPSLPVYLILEQCCPNSQSLLCPNPQLSFKKCYSPSERNVDFKIMYLY